MPCTPQAANALRSAWIPAPPPESEPAIDSTRGIRSAVSAVRPAWEAGGPGVEELQPARERSDVIAAEVTCDRRAVRAAPGTCRPARGGSSQPARALRA